MKFLICSVLIFMCPPLALIIVPGAFWLWACKEDRPMYIEGPQSPTLLSKFLDYIDPPKSSGGGYIRLDGNGKIVRNVSRYLSNPNGNYKGIK